MSIALLQQALEADVLSSLAEAALDLWRDSAGHISTIAQSAASFGHSLEHRHCDSVPGWETRQFIMTFVVRVRSMQRSGHKLKLSDYCR
jgi:hypothetical protein